MSDIVASGRRLLVRHATICRYDKPVQKSRHRVHLRPIHDHRQSLISHSLKITPEAAPAEFEDVFGNQAARFDIETPYQELRIEAESIVELPGGDPFAFTALPGRPQFPVHWMPWELKMLSPYLQSQELPDTQLSELYDYAKTFAERNRSDLIETLFDINLTLFREYKYVPGSTTVATTPFDVFVNKRGVCQDFANLFITLARLMGLPARYVCGYIYTGNVGNARAQSDASHAWVQIYIPNVGWKDFDPTNGVLPTDGHVRVGCGRHYRDTAPTSGTLYTPAVETMTIEVEVRDLAKDAVEPKPEPEAKAAGPAKASAAEPAAVGAAA